MRTTSSLESMNAALRRTFPVHPHIFKFMDRLRIHEFSKFLDMLEAASTIASDQQLQRRKLKDQKREAKIKKLTEELNSDGGISPGQFLEKMAIGKKTLTETVDKCTCML